MHMQAHSDALLTASPLQPPATATATPSLALTSGSLEARPRDACYMLCCITGLDDNEMQGASALHSRGRAAPGRARIARTQTSIHVVDGGLAPLLVANDGDAPGARAGVAGTSGEDSRAVVAL
jgi:hypothetical protein